MLEIFGSLLSGGVTGLLGTVLTGVLDHFEARRKHDEALDLRRLDLEITRVEAESAEKRSALSVEAVAAQAESSALAASYQAASARMSTGESGWLVAVDVVRGLIRPVLTVVLVAMVGLIFYISPASRGEVVATVLYLCSTCVVWWFGGRRRQAPGPGRA